MDLSVFEAEVGKVERPPDLWELCTRFYRQQGMIRVSYHHLPPPGAPDADRMLIRTDGFPEAWVARYVTERMWRDDPIVLYARDNPAPFYWSEIVERREVCPDKAAFVAALKGAGIGDGLGIQVFGPNGRNGYAGLGLPEGATPLPPAQVHELHWACQLSHLRYCSLLAAIQEPPPPLSPREFEVLTWVARGKSNSIIGDILGISAHTVDAHLRRVYLKLGVADRISATVRGIGVGLIHAEP